MARTVYVVFDTELEKVIGVYDNPEAADDCENASPGDRFTEAMDLQRKYDEDEDPRVFDDDVNDVDHDRGKIRDSSYDDEEFYEPEEDDPDPYGD